MPNENDNLKVDQMAKQYRDGDDAINAMPCIIKVIGVGGGGCNAIQHMYDQYHSDSESRISYVVCNTDRQALKNSTVPEKILIGDGEGAGSIPEVALAYAERDIDRIRKIFDEDTKMVFVTAGMGGGTGTGAGPVVAREAKAAGKLTVGIVTVPFIWEGIPKINKALDGVDQMAANVDALLVINNERLTEVYGDMTWVNAFTKADDTLSTAARSISDLIVHEGHINLDFQDVNTTLKDSGAAIISTGVGEGEHRVTAAIEDALNSPLLKNRDILSSQRLLINIYFDPNAEEPFMMGEAQEITDFVTRINPNVEIIPGQVYDPTLGNKVKITLLAAGFEVSIRDEEQDTINKSKESKKAADVVSKRQGARTSQATPKGTDARLMDQYGINTNTMRLNLMVLPIDRLNDNELIEQFESTPTYKRDRRVAALSNPKESTPAAKKTTTAAKDAPKAENPGQCGAGTQIVF